MRITPITRPFVMCPRCRTSSWPVGHISVNMRFGPWVCSDRECRAQISGVALEDGTFDIEVTDAPGLALTLLRFRDIYLVIGGYQQSKGDSWDYLYHSHQCPGNLLRSTVDVFSAEEPDHTIRCRDSVHSGRQGPDQQSRQPRRRNRHPCRSVRAFWHRRH